MPSLDIMARCFETNPHGAGFMYRAENKIHVVKGFMTLDALLNALNLVSESVNLIKTDVCIHFRISTTGSTIPANCHPFPLSGEIDDLKALSITCDRAIAHNGILYEYSKFHNDESDLSDTMYFAKMLSGVNDRFLPVVIERHAVGSRFVLMTNKKTISFGMIKEKGLFYSNQSFRVPMGYKPVIPSSTIQTPLEDVDPCTDCVDICDDRCSVYKTKQKIAFERYLMER